ncbi:RNA-binding protein NOB1-like [Panonychus citri]|uniref:RNA-binding protein NOB1-like n=1 Tax=Panonychus citri TaxID=50023 RepID=UPI00230715FB|nr:RNA-binding protein NOB1-like [Panonychus citri]
MTEKKFKWLIVDSSGFINGFDIHELTENVVTLVDVIGEIKDRQTKERLSRLPYQIDFRDPDPEDVKIVSQFSRKTGDYASLSPVDLKLIALTYGLDVQAHGGKNDHLNKEPKIIVTDNARALENVGPIKLPGFFNPRKGNNGNEEKTETEKGNIKGSDEISGDGDRRDNENVIIDENENEGNCENLENNLENQNDEREAGNEDSEEDDDDEDDDDPDSWITPNNLAAAEEAMKNLVLEEDKCLVACMTSDFAMQNVLIQMGLKVASVRGLVIKQARQFILRCHACYKTTCKMDKKFCPSCGNHGTLKRVSVVVNEKGEKVIQINFKRQISTRGTKYSLPMPKGGKHGNDPILFEDQRRPQNRPSKLTFEEKKALNCNSILSDPGYVIRSTPFALNDVYSRASKFTKQKMASHNRRNPNEVGPATGNRKKSKSKI